jgi:phycoerythrobilin:ferredoxin oxidoreductase
VEWNEWYTKHVLSKMDQKFPWGGDFPEPVQQYVSRYALWTRLQGISDDPIQVIQNDVYDAFVDHLDIYLGLLRKTTTTTTTCAGTDAASNTDSQSVQASYLEYRKNNDPAKPMLTSLYGQGWTEKLLHTVLFPKDT